MDTAFESAWPRYPGYRIDLVPSPRRGRVRAGDLVLAESDRCLVVEESDHQARLYFPNEDVRWEHLEPSDAHTVCPFKGEADYWTLTATDPVQQDVAWAYPEPLEEVAGLAGHVCFYDERLHVELEERWSAPPGHTAAVRFPNWGDAADLLRLIDVEPAGAGTYTSPPYPDPPMGTFIPVPPERQRRNVIEGGQLLGAAIAAASREVPDQRVTSAHMLFSKAATFDAPVEVGIDVLRRGRTFSTVEARLVQDDRLRSVGLLLMDAGAADVMRGAAEIPDVPEPMACPHLDMGVTGREIRVVDGAYRRTPDETGPPVLHVWIRYRDAPDDAALHAALLAQATTHWTIAAAMRPHAGVTEDLAHVALSTGPMAVELALHDDAEVTEWMLYSNPAVYAGRGQAQGRATVHAEDGRLLASYSVQAMVRDLVGPGGAPSPNAM